MVAIMKTFTVTAQRAGRWWALECAEAEKLVASAASSSRLVAKEMKDDGFTLRDIGQVMGISYQRAGQLVAACNRD
ncbi:hypothetical protein FYZ42_06470 [Mobiluncus mulieris]|nr:hypothetical protein [Mobiluncus mulieris]NMW91107.1 hypothetical protein [Mobiluncus mulieris]